MLGAQLEYFKLTCERVNILAPLRNLTMIVLSQGPTVHCIVMGRISSHYTFKVEGDSLRSNFSCRKESTTPIVHLRGSSRWEEQSIVNRLHPKARARLLERALAWVKVSSTADGQNTQVCHVSFKNHTWRFPDLDVGATRHRAPEKGGPSSEWCARRGCHEEHEFRKPGPARLHSLPGRQQSPAQDKCVLDCHRSAVLGTDGTIGPQVWISPSRGTVLWLPLPVGQGQSLSAAPASTSSWYYPCVFEYPSLVYSQDSCGMQGRAAWPAAL